MENPIRRLMQQKKPDTPLVRFLRMRPLIPGILFLLCIVAYSFGSYAQNTAKHDSLDVNHADLSTQSTHKAVEHDAMEFLLHSSAQTVWRLRATLELCKREDVIKLLDEKEHDDRQEVLDAYHKDHEHNSHESYGEFVQAIALIRLGYALV